MSAPSVIFIHGLWIHSSAWEPWLALFAEAGYATSAPGWPGDRDTVAETRDDPSGLDGVGIEAICRSYADVIDGLDEKPIVIGHSFGGLIAQELLANGYATAAIAIDPAPIKGVKILPFSQLRAGLPVLGNPANKSRTVALTAKQFRYAFGNAISEYVEFEGRGHSLTMDAGWRDIADACLSWLDGQGLQPASDIKRDSAASEVVPGAA